MEYAELVSKLRKGAKLHMDDHEIPDGKVVFKSTRVAFALVTRKIPVALDDGMAATFEGNKVDYLDASEVEAVSYPAPKRSSAREAEDFEDMDRKRVAAEARAQVADVDDDEETPKRKRSRKSA